MKVICILLAAFAVFTNADDANDLVSALDDLDFGNLPADKEIEDTIRSQIGTIKSIMVTGDPENKVPPMDPYMQDSNVPNQFNVESYSAKATIKITNAKITGLSKFELTDLKVSVADKSLEVGLKVPRVEVEGQYKVNGSFQLDGPVPMDGMGPFTAEVIEPEIKVYLKLDYENGTGLTVTGSSVELDYEDLDFELEGFMNGNPLKFLVLRSINFQSREYFEDNKESIEEQIGDFMVSAINTVLDQAFGEPEAEQEQKHVIQKRQSCGTGNMNQYIDQVITNARPLIRSKADPLRLKNLKKVVELYDGKVTGLSSIRRTGNVVLSCTASKLTLSVNFGFGSVSAGYRWKRKILFVKLRGDAKIRFKSLSVSAIIGQARTSGAHPTIEKLDLHLRGVRVHLSGLSIAGHIIAAIISLLSNIFRKAVANAMEKPIKRALQKELNKITLPF